MNPTLRPTQSRSRTPRIAVALGGVGAVIAAVVMGYSDVAEQVAVRHWLPTTCAITSSTVDEVAVPTNTRTTLQERSRPTYTANISYRYTVQGRVYTGNREHFVTLTSNDKADPQKSVLRYGTGTSTACWYDPAMPSASIIDRSPDLLVGLMPLMLFVAGVGMLLFAAFGNRSAAWVGMGGGAQSSGSPPFAAPESFRDVEALLTAKSATRAPQLMALRGINPGVAIVVILVIVLFIVGVVIYGYRTWMQLA
jgi:hypothetical protein